MPVQTSVSAPGIAYPGLLSDSGFNNYIESFANASGIVIDFGLGVIRGTNDREAKVPTTANQEFLGVTIRNEMRENSFINFVSDGTAYLPGEMMNVLAKQGCINVLVEQDVIAGGAVYCRFLANGGFTTLGAFRADSDTTASVAHAFLVPNGIFNTTTSAGGIAKILFPK